MFHEFEDKIHGRPIQAKIVLKTQDFTDAGNVLHVTQRLPLDPDSLDQIQSRDSLDHACRCARWDSYLFYADVVPEAER